jgi:flagellar hook protein FlgE
MIGSLYAGISGLNANSWAMSVIGDNIANVNTTAFKSSRPSFANLLNQSLAGYTGNEVGKGVTVAGLDASWNQGSLETTGNATDLAINGKGFFIMSDNGQELYTRAGAFHFDQDGNLVNNSGLVVQGWDVSTGGIIGGATTDVTVPLGGTVPAQATQEFTANINLDATAVDGETFSTSFIVYDSLGNDIPMTVTFTKTANPNEWSWAATVPASAGVMAGGDTGTLTFNPDGSLAAGGVDPSMSVNWSTGAASPQTISWDLYEDSTASNGSMTQHAVPSITSFTNQDGYLAGTLQSITINEEGTISGTYSNGQINNLYQIAIADFPSYAGLTKLGGNLYGASLDSGQVLRGVPGQGSMGGLSTNALEMSNVDLATEFVRLITTQRAFQANSRVITTSDEILNELINIKR